MINTNIEQQAQETANDLTKQNASLITGCCLVGSHIQSSSGERTLPNAKVEFDGTKIESNLVKGSKIQWFPRDRLRVTSKYTQKLSRLFSGVGIRYGEMTVVPKERLPELQSELDQIRFDWQNDVDALVDDYDVIMSHHISSNPEIAEIIKKFALDKVDFERCFKLTYLKPLAIRPLFEDDVKELESQIASTMWEEISKEAADLYKASWFSDKKAVSRVSQKVKAPLRRLMEKMMSLSFLDEGVINITRTIQQVIDKLPKAGYIEGHDFLQLTHWVHVMSDQEKLKMHANGSPQFVYEPPVASIEVIPDLEIEKQPSSECIMTEALEQKTLPSKPLSQASLFRTSEMDFGGGF